MTLPEVLISPVVWFKTTTLLPSTTFPFDYIPLFKVHNALFIKVPLITVFPFVEFTVT